MEVDLLDDIMGWLLLFFWENQMQLCWKSLAATRMLLIDTDAGPRVLVPCAKSQSVEQWVGVKIESLWTFSRFGQTKGPARFQKLKHQILIPLGPVKIT